MRLDSSYNSLQFNPQIEIITKLVIFLKLVVFVITSLGEKRTKQIIKITIFHLSIIIVIIITITFINYG